MKFKLSFPLLSVAVLLASSQVATASPLSSQKPAACPTVDAVQAVGVTRAMAMSQDGGWAAWSTGQYGTNEEWMFGTMIAGQDNNNQASVVAKVNAKLANISLATQEPISGPQNRWMCVYQGQEFFAVAVTPPLDIPQAIISTLKSRV